MRYTSAALLMSIMLVSLAESVFGQDVIIDHGFETLTSQQVVAIVEFAASNSRGYDGTDFEFLELYEDNGLFPVDTDDGNYDDSNQLGGGFWGGGWDVTDTSVQPNSQYCYSSFGAILASDFSEFPVSLEFNSCTPPPSPPSGLVVIWGGFSCHTCDCTEYDVYHHASNAATYTMQQSLTSSGPWINNGTTVYTSSYPHISTGGRWMRVKASNAAGTVYSSPHWAAGVCDYCGGGGAEP